MPGQNETESKIFDRQTILKHYKYIHIWASTNEVRVQCTDQKTLRVLIRSIQRTYPDSHVETRDDLTNQNYSVKISDLEPQDRHQKIAWWLFKMMCQQGWEPMATGEHWYKMKAWETQSGGDNLSGPGRR